MKRITCAAATAALLLFGSLSHARGAPTSSFAPRGPEPHSSLNDKHRSKKTGRASGHDSTHKGIQTAMPKTANHSQHKN